MQLEIFSIDLKTQDFDLHILQLLILSLESYIQPDDEFVTRRVLQLNTLNNTNLCLTKVRVYGHGKTLNLLLHMLSKAFRL